MSNQFTNPIIQFRTVDTISHCILALSYVMSSIESVELETITEDAQQGLYLALCNIRQALAFEVDRLGDDIYPAPRVNSELLNSLESGIVKSLSTTLVKDSEKENEKTN